jgi:hypothetical protein
MAATRKLPQAEQADHRHAPAQPAAGVADPKGGQGEPARRGITVEPLEEDAGSRPLRPGARVRRLQRTFRPTRYHPGPTLAGRGSGRQPRRSEASHCLRVDAAPPWATPPISCGAPLPARSSRAGRRPCCARPAPGPEPRRWPLPPRQWRGWRPIHDRLRADVPTASRHKWLGHGSWPGHRTCPRPCRPGCPTAPAPTLRQARADALGPA